MRAHTASGPTTTRVRRGRWGVTLLAGALVLAACGGDDAGVGTGTTASGSGSITEQPATAEGLEAAVRAANEALLSGDVVDAYSVLTARCRATVSQAEWAAQLTIARGFLEAFAGVQLSDLEVSEVLTRNVTETTGEAQAVVTAPDGSTPLDEAEPSWETWQYEDGGWRSDDCEGFDESTDDTTPAVSIPPGALGGTFTGGADAFEEADELEVVAQGPAGQYVPVVVRNGTDETVYEVEVSATARGDDGSLLATGKDQGVEPAILAPGEVAVGVVFVDLPDDQEDADGVTVELTVTAADEPSLFARYPLEVIETNDTGEAVVGIVRNPHEVAISGFARVVAMCLGDSGEPLEALTGSIDQDEIAPGGEATFTLSYYDRPDGCPSHAVGASGYEA